MGLESFVFENSLFVNIESGEVDNRLSEIILSLSNSYPFVYGFISIIVVILIGVSFSYVRELIHYIRYDMKEKNYKFFK